MEVGKEFGLLESEMISYGPHKAKISLDVLKRLENRPDGRLVVVTAITPTRAGEGKTTSAISLTQGLGRIGANVALCLRQPSTGPLFGIKGGGTGGGLAQIVPMEEINLHFTGDIHAVEAAHNLLAAVIDAAIFHGQLEIGPSFITWPRTLDVNDRALRDIVTGLGGDEHGVPRESSFIIAAASEIMAILPLAKLGNQHLDALKRGAESLAAHIDIVRAFGMRSVVAINRFPEDTDRELRLLSDLAEQFGADAAVVNDGFSRGGEGSVELAEAVLAATKDGSNFAPLYAADTPIREQIQTLARRLYGAADVEFLPECQKRIDWLTERGMGTLPVCMSKTHLSLSHNPALKGRPLGFTLPIRNVYPSAGAGFVVALAGDIQLMPGLGKEPAYTRIELGPNGQITGLT